MSIIKFIALLIFILIVINQDVIPQEGQYFLKGKIIDSHDSSPLPGVNILIIELKLGTATNEEGDFSFVNISSGEYTLKVSYIGHQTVIKKVSVPRDEIINIEMTESAIDLAEVTVTGNPLEIDPKNISQATLQLSKLDLQIKRGSTLAETLNFQPGISVRSNGMATSYPVIRGFTNNRILVLEDGLRIGDLSNASDDHSISGDGNTPEKIEVLRGPASLLYGSNAIGGVINILTDIIPSSVPQTLNGSVDLSVSSVDEEYLGSGHLNFGIDKFSFHTNYYKRKGKDYRIPGGEKVSNSDFHNRGYQIGTAYHPDWGSTGLSFTDFETQYGIPVNLNTLDEGEGPIFLYMQKKQARILTEISSIPLFIKSLSLKAAYQDYKHKEILRSTGEVGTNFGLKTFSADLSFKHIPIGELNGIFGFWGLNQNYTVEGKEAFTPNADYLSFAAYIFEKVELGNFHIQFGSRYEINKTKIPENTLSDSLLTKAEKNYHSFSGSLGAVYNLTDHISLFGNAANAFRAPTVEELSSFAIHEATGSFDIGNRNLARENNLGFDFGLRVLKDNHTVELSLYYNNIRNFIFRQNTGLYYDSGEEDAGYHLGFNNSTGVPVFIYRQSDAELYGVETKARYEFFRSVSVTVIFDYVRGTNKNTGEFLPQIPPMRFSIEPRYTTDYFWAGFQWKLTAKQDKTALNETPTNGYGLVDLYAGTKLLTGNFAHIFNLKAENLLDQSYKDHLSAIKDFAFMPGRNFELSYKFVF